ncbi:MAG: tripartite tricarboxylate transporter permease [Neofamilia sp.]
MGAFLSGFGVMLQFSYILYMFGGVAFGMFLGVLPGLSGSMGIALALPLTFSMDPLTSLVFLLSIYTGGLFGGAITSIVINTPGSPANMATLFDGYPMAQRGQTGRALGLALGSSSIGGLIGVVFLALVTKPLADIALKFGPAEMFMVAIFGLSVVGSLSKNVLKSLFAGAFGILIGTIGMSNTGAIRGTMGSIFLFNGLPLTPTLIGLLAIPSIFDLAVQEQLKGDYKQSSLKEIIDGMIAPFKKPVLTVLTSLLGVIVGVMPAAGATVAGLLSYNQTKQWSKKSDEFGTGIDEGIIAAETANNASAGGALSTMFVLGIPGSNSTAMMMGALIIQGWAPGPRLFIDNQEVIYQSFASLFLQQIVMLFIGLIMCYFAVQILKVPTKLLVPIILLFTIVGSFSNRNAIFDVFLMLGLGAAGWFMKKSDFDIMPIILGIILGPIADTELLRIFQSYNSFMYIFTQPIVIILLVITVLSLGLPMLGRMKSKSREKQTA